MWSFTTRLVLSRLACPPGCCMANRHGVGRFDLAHLRTKQEHRPSQPSRFITRRNRRRRSGTQAGVGSELDEDFDGWCWGPVWRHQLSHRCACAVDDPDESSFICWSVGCLRLSSAPEEKESCCRSTRRSALALLLTVSRETAASSQRRVN